MQKKNTRFKKTDIIVILICLFGICLSIILFWTDFTRTLAKISEKPVGTVSYKYKAAQRKFIDRVLWDRLRQESPVYNGDVIRTADLSEARVTFLDGQAVELFENTLAQIFWNEKQAYIDLSVGDISINSRMGSNPIVLSSGNSLIEIAPGGVLNAKLNNLTQELNIMLIDGNASITSSSGEIQALAAGDALSFLEDGTGQIAPIVAVLSPAPAAHVINNSREDFPLSFIWKTNNFAAGEYVYIEIAHDTSFNRIVYASDIKDTVQVVIPLPSGTFWWRIYPSSFKDAENYIKNIASGRISIHHAPSPGLIKPIESYVYYYRTQLPAVRFLWTEAQETSAYRLDVANNPQMQNPTISRQLFNTSVIISSLAPGTWYWKVTPLYPENYMGTTASSVVSSFTFDA